MSFLATYRQIPQRKRAIALGFLILVIIGGGEFVYLGYLNSVQAQLLQTIREYGDGSQFRHSLQRINLLETASKLITLLACVIGIGFVLFGYLRPETYDLRRIETVILPELHASAEATRGVTSGSGDVTPLPQTNFSSTADGMSPANSEVVSSDSADPRERRITQLFDTTQVRLSGEIKNLERRSNVNLATGVAITSLAAGVLLYLVTRQHPDFTTMPGVLNYYLPRVTTIALIEFFAYFFLGLYKANLQDIKYYQNERTTVVAKEVAWRASLWPEIGKSTAKVIEQIVKTDRNSAGGGGDKSVPSNQTEVVELVKSLSAFAVKSIGKEGRSE